MYIEHFKDVYAPVYFVYFEHFQIVYAPDYGRRRLLNITLRQFHRSGAIQNIYTSYST